MNDPGVWEWVVWTLRDGEPAWPWYGTMAGTRSLSIRLYDKEVATWKAEKYRYRRRQRRGEVLCLRTRMVPES